MTPSERGLQWRASTIDDRLGCRRIAAHEVSASVSRRLALWHRFAADGDEDTFRRRLELDGLTDADVPAIADDRPPSSGMTVLAWLQNFRWIAACLNRAPTDEELHRILDVDNPCPFEELFVTTVIEAAIRAGLGDRTDLLQPSGIRSLQHLLLSRLTNLSEKVLFESFTLFRSLQDLNEQRVSGTANRTIYVEFLEHMRHEDFEVCFSHRPVLARILATTIMSWIRNVSAFVDRFSKDRPRIADSLLAGSHSVRIAEVRGGMSDPHNGGLGVLKVVLCDGSQIGYKPKCLAVDVAFRRLLEWLGARGAPATCEVPSALDCGSYGWVEWTQGKPCRTTDELKTFFFRAGSMLCLFA
jgi:lantibiotic modifying enzyme